MTHAKHISQLPLRARAAYLASCARYQAEKSKPPTRKQAQAWLLPIRRAFNEIRTGEVDAYRGYPITRIHAADNDFARVDHAVNGFVALIDRVIPDFDTEPMKRVARKLAAGVLMKTKEIDACFALLNQCEDRLIKISRNDLKDAAQIEQINIELERLDLVEAA